MFDELQKFLLRLEQSNEIMQIQLEKLKYEVTISYMWLHD